MIARGDRTPKRPADLPEHLNDELGRVDELRIAPTHVEWATLN